MDAWDEGVLPPRNRGGSLGAVEMAMFEVPKIDMQDALEIIVLMAKADDPRFDKWAQRWADRAATAGREQLTELVALLPDESAARALRTHAEQLRQPPAPHA